MLSPQTHIQDGTIRIWEHLQLVTGKPGREGYYSCRVTDIKKDRLIISRPVFDYGHTLLANNRVVDVNFTRADAAYTFTARLKETAPKSPDRMFLINLGAVRRQQRRRFVRLDETIAIGYQALPQPVKEPVELEKDNFTKINTINISAGGLLFPASDAVQIGTTLLLDMASSGFRKVPRYMFAVCRQARKNEDKLWVAGAEFIVADDLYHHLRPEELSQLPEEVTMFTFRMQNELVAEIFAKQLILRKKGLL